MSNDVVPDPSKHLFGQAASPRIFEFGSVANNYTFKKSVSDAAPVKRSVGIIFRTFRCQDAGELKQLSISARHAFDQLRTEG